MATSHLKSTSITNLDTIPVLYNTSGAGGAAMMRTINDFAVALAADAAGSTYQLVRIPTTAVVKAVVFESEAQGAGAVDIGLYYSDATNDGTPSAKQGLVVPSPGINFFATDVNIASAVTPTNVTNQSGNYNLSLRNEPLWQAVGLAADPGGYFDVVATVHTTAVTTGTGRLGVLVDYTN